MLVYSVVMFLTAVIFGALGIAVYRGKTQLIHEYHQSKVKDKEAYGKAFGKGLLLMASAMLLSGILRLSGTGDSLAGLAVGLLLLGLLVGIGYIIGVQKKYNQGIF